MTLKDVCLEIEKRYEVHFLEIGTDKDHVHLLIQSVPTKSASEIIRMVKSITGREVFKKHPEVKEKL
jgi:REP element-mobilizing transposase RayT